MIKSLGHIAGIIGFVYLRKPAKFFIKWIVVLELTAFIGICIQSACSCAVIGGKLVHGVQRERHGGAQQII